MNFLTGLMINNIFDVELTKGNALSPVAYKSKQIVSENTFDFANSKVFAKNSEKCSQFTVEKPLKTLYETVIFD